MADLTQKTTLRDSAAMRWIALLLLALAMFCSYIFMDILSPIKDLMESTRGWDSKAFGTMEGAETFLNVFVFFLIFAGIILDKMGVRFTAVLSGAVMLIGGLIKYLAISDAFNLLRLGKADVIIAGGSEAAVVECSIGGFGSMQALSCRNDDPATASRPFDKDRDGFVLAEGAGALVLEELEHAKRRGAKIYAELTGCGLSADAYHITASHPEGQGAYEAMKYAIEDSEMKLEDVDHINTHGTSTPIGDISEPKAIARLFGEHAKEINLNSTKSMTGHLLGAAGSVEAIATILAIKNGIIPPTINHFTDDPNIEPLNFTFNKAVKRDIRFALSNAFGFGGHNVSLAFRKVD